MNAFVKKIVNVINHLVFTPPAPPWELAKFANHTLVRHTKGGLYLVVGQPTVFVLEHDRTPAYAYLMQDGRICIRTQLEFEDGRFTQVGKEEAETLWLAGDLDFIEKYFDQLNANCVVMV